MMQDRYFFLHIPKTAGVSLHHLLADTAGPYLHLRHPHERCWPSESIWARFAGCGGHLTWAEAERRGFLAGYKLTFLRDPVERVLSQHSFAQLAVHGNLPDAAQARRFDLNQLLRRSAGSFGSFWNVQTFFLSGLDPREPRPETHLASALENLEKFDFVGTSEHFAEDGRALVRALQKNAPASLPFENRNLHRLKRDDLDAETLALLEETQAMDRVLYARAQELRRRAKPSAWSVDRSSLAGWPPPREEFSTGEVKITRIEIREIQGGPLLPGTEAELHVHWTARTQITDLILGVAIEDVMGNYIAGTNTALLTNRTSCVPAGDAQCLFRFKVEMGAGRYSATVAIHRETRELCRINFGITFEVATPTNPYREGMVNFSAKAEVRPTPTSHALPDIEARKISLRVVGPPELDIQFKYLHVPIEVLNESERRLSSADPCRIFASYRWLSVDDSAATQEGGRSPLLHDLWPSEKTNLRILVIPPPEPGRWRLQVRLVQEGVRWHEGAGFEKSTPPDLHLVYHKTGRYDLEAELERLQA